jgi:hypothetical protein
MFLAALMSASKSPHFLQVKGKNNEWTNDWGKKD